MREFELLENIPLHMLHAGVSRYSFEYYDPLLIEDKREKAETIEPVFPPLLFKEHEKYEILQGKLFVDQCRRRSQFLPYGLLLMKKCDDLELLLYLVHLKKETGGFNTVEKAIAVSRFYEMIGHVPEELLMLLEIPKNEKYLKGYLQLTKVPEEVKLAILRKNLHELTAFKIFRFPEESWLLLTKFISNLFIGTKKRNEIIEMLRMISDGSRESLECILKSDELCKILKSGIDPPQVASRIYDFIKEKRYPAMSQYLKRFNRKLREVGFGKNLHLTLPKDFEQWEFALNIKFSSVEELKKELEGLKKISESESFSELMRLRY